MKNKKKSNQNKFKNLKNFKMNNNKILKQIKIIRINFKNQKY